MTNVDDASIYRGSIKQCSSGSAKKSCNFQHPELQDFGCSLFDHNESTEQRASYFR